MKQKRFSLCSEVHSQVQLTILQALSAHCMKAGRLLDVGCWDGATTLRYAETTQAAAVFGVEGFPEMANEARRRGICVETLNIESEAFPFEDESFDIVVCNQVLEHLKDVFRPMDEMLRVAKPGGILIISVPNLASFHSRLMLLGGVQPSSIRVFGPHVRGFAFSEMKRFLTSDDTLQWVDTLPVGFYPFRATGGIAKVLAGMWKGGCHTPVFVLRKCRAGRSNFKERYIRRTEQTVM